MTTLINTLIFLAIAFAIFLIIDLYLKLSKKVDLEVNILEQELINLKENQSLLPPIDHPGTPNDIHTMVKDNNAAQYDNQMDIKLNNIAISIDDDAIDASEELAKLHKQIMADPVAHLANKYEQESKINTGDHISYDEDDDFFVPKNIIPKTKRPLDKVNNNE